MTALEQIFQGYYDERINEDSDPEEMQVLHMKLMEALEYLRIETKVQGNIMETVSVLEMQAEKIGFMAGFRMAWKLLKDIQDIPV